MLDDDTETAYTLIAIMVLLAAMWLRPLCVAIP